LVSVLLLSKDGSIRVKLKLQKMKEDGGELKKRKLTAYLLNYMVNRKHWVNSSFQLFLQSRWHTLESYSFEEDCLHKDVHNTLIRLVKSHRVNTKSVFNDRWFFPNKLTWEEVESLAKEKLELINTYVSHPRRFEKDSIVYMDYSEYLVEQALISSGYVVVAKDTYSFNGRPTDLDFIAKVPQKDVFVGIQVKNRMQHPSLADVYSLLNICGHLKVRPVLVARIIHPKTYELLKENGGRALRVKRYFLQPPFPRDKFKEIVDLGIPLGVYNRPPDFLITMLTRLADFF
jgi:hypothetical protein